MTLVCTIHHQNEEVILIFIICPHNRNHRGLLSFRSLTMSARGGKKDNDEEYTPYDAENDSNALIVDGKKKKTKKVGFNIQLLSGLFSMIP